MEFGKTRFKNVYQVGTDVHIKHVYKHIKQTVNSGYLCRAGRKGWKGRKRERHKMRQIE